MSKEMHELLAESREDTRRHRVEVSDQLHILIKQLLIRRDEHDISKMEEPELSTFAVYGPKLKEMEYGSGEYRQALSEMKVALDHHYANNRHHPEFHDHGVEDMNLIDLVEMVCDWYAASKRMKDGGSFEDSLEKNRKRFGLSAQLARIISNTFEVLAQKE